MDWKELGQKIAGIGLPLLGSLLPIPGGAKLGEALANKIGAAGASPDSIWQQLASDAKALEAAKRLEMEYKQAMREADSKDLETVNATMQKESGAEHWAQWGWRPYWGFISGTMFGYVCIMVGVLSYKAVIMQNANAVGMIPVIIGAFTALFSIPGAILGITAWGRNKMKNIKALTR